MKWSRGHSEAAVYGVASLLSGGIIYLFVIYSARRLDLVQFGQLTSWIAYISIGFAIAGLAQYGSNFFVASEKLLSSASIGIFLMSMVLALIPFLLGDQAGWYSAAAVAIVLGLASGWLMGQAQIRLLFTLMGLSALMAALSRFLMVELPFPTAQESLGFAWGVSLSYIPSFLLLAIAFGLGDRAKIPSQLRARQTSEGILATIVLAYASVIWPQVDIMVVHQTQTPELIGSFARVSIIYKGVFFVFLLLTQVLLPFQMRSGGEGWLQRRWRIGLLLLSIILALCVVGASRFAMSFVDGRPISDEMFLWIILGCLNMAVVTNVFIQVQNDCVHENAKKSAFIVGATTLFAAVAIMWRPPVHIYLAAALLVNFTLWLIQFIRLSGLFVRSYPH